MMPVLAGPEFGAATNCTSPLPELDAPASTVIQSTVLTAVQVHGPSTITSTAPSPPFASKLTDGGATVHLQEDA